MNRFATILPVIFGLAVMAAGTVMVNSLTAGSQGSSPEPTFIGAALHYAPYIAGCLALLFIMVYGVLNPEEAVFVLPAIGLGVLLLGIGYYAVDQDFFAPGRIAAKKTAILRSAGVIPSPIADFGYNAVLDCLHSGSLFGPNPTVAQCGLTANHLVQASQFTTQDREAAQRGHHGYRHANA